MIDALGLRATNHFLERALDRPRVGALATQAHGLFEQLLVKHNICAFHVYIVYHGVTMALNIKNAEVERLASEISRLTGESKTEAIRRALEERRGRLRSRSADERRARVLKLLEKKVWPALPKAQVGRRLTRAEEDEILGYGPAGV